MARGSSSYTARSIRRNVGRLADPPDLDAAADRHARLYAVLFSDVRSGLAFQSVVRSHCPAFAVEAAKRRFDASARDGQSVLHPHDATNISVARWKVPEPPGWADDETDEEAVSRRERYRRDRGHL